MRSASYCGAIRVPDSQHIPLKRQEFRRYFQPSRIVLGVFVVPRTGRVNVITLCFNMHCSYKPPMMAVAIANTSYTFTLLEAGSEFVLGVPGESMANAVIQCGLESGRTLDKVTALGLRLGSGDAVKVPILKQCIANVELRAAQLVRTGDHTTVIGEVAAFRVNVENRERPLVSVGPQHSGYELLARSGIHRIAVASAYSSATRPSEDIHAP